MYIPVVHPSKTAKRYRFLVVQNSNKNTHRSCQIWLRDSSLALKSLMSTNSQEPGNETELCDDILSNKIFFAAVGMFPDGTSGTAG